MKKRSDTRDRLVFVVVMALAVGLLSAMIMVAYLLMSRLETLTTNNDIPLAIVMFSVLMAFVMIMWAIMLVQRQAREGLPMAFNIAVVGFPQTGKTTLITTFFNELFERSIINIDVRLTSESTIDRVNEDLKRLQMGKAILPTRGDDVFAYRAVFTRSGGLLMGTSSYQIQIGDFPGEDSEKYMLEYGEWLHPPPFFRWVAEADAIIFTVDISKVMDGDHHLDQAYVAMMCAAIRAAWQRLLTDNTNERRTTREKSLAIVFTKADLLVSAQAWDVHQLNAKRLHDPDYEGIIPETVELEDEDQLEPYLSQLTAAFRGLTTYLSGSAQHFDVFFTSSFMTVGGKRLGIAQLARFILPR